MKTQVKIIVKLLCYCQNSEFSYRRKTGPSFVLVSNCDKMKVEGKRRALTKRHSLISLFQLNKHHPNYYGN